MGTAVTGRRSEGDIFILLLLPRSIVVELEYLLFLLRPYSRKREHYSAAEAASSVSVFHVSEFCKKLQGKRGGNSRKMHRLAAAAERGGEGGGEFISRDRERGGEKRVVELHFPPPPSFGAGEERERAFSSSLVWVWRLSHEPFLPSSTSPLALGGRRDETGEGGNCGACWLLLLYYQEGWVAFQT